jgi:hypothetical protein
VAKLRQFTRQIMGRGIATTGVCTYRSCE